MHMHLVEPGRGERQGRTTPPSSRSRLSTVNQAMPFWPSRMGVAADRGMAERAARVMRTGWTASRVQAAPVDCGLHRCPPGWPLARGGHLWLL